MACGYNQSKLLVTSPWISFFFFQSLEQKTNTDDFDGGLQRQNWGETPQVIGFQGQQVSKSHFMTLKIPHVFAKCYFHTGNYCSRRMWPLSEEQRRHPLGDLCSNEVPVTINYSFIVLTASKILIVILFFLVSTDGEGFSLHSLWSEKSRSWTLDKCNVQCIIPIKAQWFQYLLY